MEWVYTHTDRVLCVMAAANSSTGENVPQPIPTLPTRPFLFGTGPQASVTSQQNGRPASIYRFSCLEGNFRKDEWSGILWWNGEEAQRTRAGHVAYKIQGHTVGGAELRERPCFFFFYVFGSCLSPTAIENQSTFLNNYTHTNSVTFD